MFVTIQVQSTRKPYPWVDTFRAKVLYADRKIIFARTAGGHSEFLPGSGRRIFGSYLTKHPTAKKIPRRGTWRIHPEGLKRIKAEFF